MHIPVSRLIDPPTSWNSLLIGIEGRAREGWADIVQDVYGVVIEEIAAWQQRANEKLPVETIEQYARNSAARIMQSCAGREKLTKMIRGDLKNKGHALLFFGWIMEEGGSKPDFFKIAQEQITSPSGVRFVEMLSAWGAIPTLLNDVAIPYGGLNDTHVFFRVLGKEQHPIVAALGSAAFENAEILLRRGDGVTQNTLDLALIALLLSVQNRGLKGQETQWLEKLLAMGANPNTPVSCDIQNGAQSFLLAPVNGMHLPDEIEQINQTYKYWQPPTPYTYGPQLKLTSRKIKLCANELAMNSLFKHQGTEGDEWRSIWIEQWKREAPSTHSPFTASAINKFLQAAVSFHYSNRAGEEEKKKILKDTVNELLPPLAAQSQWWRETPTLDNPWTTWETVVRTMEIEDTGTSIKAESLGTSLLRKLISTLPEKHYLSGEMIQHALQGLAQNRNFQLEIKTFFTSNGKLDQKKEIVTQRKNMEQLFSLLIEYTEPEERERMNEQKTIFFEEMANIEKFLSDEINFLEKVGGDLDQLPIHEAKKRFRLLLQTFNRPTSVPVKPSIPRM